MADYACAQGRKKKKDKKKNKKNFPYKSGGKYRGTDISPESVKKTFKKKRK